MIAAMALALSVGTCNLQTTKFDSPLSYGQFAGWNQSRWGWHATHVGLSFVQAEAIHRTTGWSRVVSAAMIPLASVAFHVYGARTGHYKVDWKDWTFDAGIRTLPLVFQSKPVWPGLVAYGVFYSRFACYASP